MIHADEPTGSLDADNRDSVMSLLQDLNAIGKTVILVTHDPVVRNCASAYLEL